MKLDELIDPREAYRLCYRSVAFQVAGPGVTDGRTLEGYAAVFDTPTVIDSYEGEFEEVVKRGAFRRTLEARTPVMQFDHGQDKRTGSLPIGAIDDIREDKQGLFVRARMFDNDLVEPIRQAIDAQAIRGMSFKFEVLRDRWIDRDGNELTPSERAERMEKGELVRREITEVKLYELGPVVFPAYEETSVGVRSRFDPSRIAVRGVLAQFGLTERCVRRHLAVFDEQARQRLAVEIEKTFPELRQLLADQRTPVPSHDTEAVERPWDVDRNVARLPSPMPLATARRVYSWYDGERVEDGEIAKDACKLPHHEVNADGTPGPANLNGVRNALSRLPQSDIPEDEQEAVRRHLRNHLPSEEEDEQASEPAPSTSDDKTDPAPRHSVRQWQSANWYLSGPNDTEGAQL